MTGHNLWAKISLIRPSIIMLLYITYYNSFSADVSAPAQDQTYTATVRNTGIHHDSI
jgi:hypothetical protein